MKFGVKAGQDTNTGTGGGDWIRYCNKDGEFTLRFLEEFDDWTAFWEHFSMEKKAAYPCTGDRNTCPGCTSDNEREAKASKRLLMNAVLRNHNDQEGYANLWKITNSLRDDLIRYRDKAGGTLTDRDYTVVRYTTDAGRTAYSLDRDQKEMVDLSKYTLRDHQEALEAAWQIAWNDEARAIRDADIANTKAAQLAAAAKEEVSEPDEVPDELKSKEELTAMEQAGKEHFEGTEEQPSQKAVKKAVKKALTLVKEEPQEEEITLTVGEIRKMSVVKLKQLYKQAGITPAETDDKSVLAEDLIKALATA